MWTHLTDSNAHMETMAASYFSGIDLLTQVEKRLTKQGRKIKSGFGRVFLQFHNKKKLVSKNEGVSPERVCLNM
jgi:hypothetical protein